MASSLTEVSLQSQPQTPRKPTLTNPLNHLRFSQSQKKMSLLTRTLTRSIPRSPVAARATRSFHSSGLRAALSESDTHRHDERQAEIVDHHKHDQLNKQKEGKGHWKGELASNSEAAVKADRGEIHNAKEDTERLQKETTEHMQEQRKGGE